MPGDLDKPAHAHGVAAMLHEAFFNSAVLLLLGAMLIGAVIGKPGMADLAPLFTGLFKGVLCLFLLDMGLLAARRLGDLRRAGRGGHRVRPDRPAGSTRRWASRPGTSWACRPATRCCWRCSSARASYIAVPAALRLSLPASNPSVYVPMSLGLTFPFNVIVGIPLYWAVDRRASGPSDRRGPSRGRRGLAADRP